MLADFSRNAIPSYLLQVIVFKDLCFLNDNLSVNNIHSFNVISFVKNFNQVNNPVTTLFLHPDTVESMQSPDQNRCGQETISQTSLAKYPRT